MKKQKPRFEISEDELMYRHYLQEEFKVKPTRRAVELLEERITTVLKKLGVNTEGDQESIQFQMQLMSIFIQSMSEEQAPKAAGLYISALIGGELQPYAYISSAHVGNDGKAWFPITYWQEYKYDEGRRVLIREK